MSDEFFDDEQELMEAEGPEPTRAPEPAPTAAPRPAAPQGDASRPAPPPFWMVLAIAVVALAFGIALGYLMGSAATINELASAGQQAPAAASPEAALPEGHPQLDIDEDGNAAVASADAAAASA